MMPEVTRQLRILVIRFLWPTVVVAAVVYLALSHSGMKENELAGTAISLRSNVSGAQY